MITSIRSAIPAAGNVAGVNGCLNTQYITAHAPPKLSSIPVSAPSAPSSAYSASRMREICARVAPSVLSSTPSRNRARRVAATALMSTGMPIASAKTARNRTASATLSMMPLTVRCTRLRSTALTFENWATVSRWIAITAFTSLTLASITKVFGAWSMASGLNTAKKLGSKRAQFTSRSDVNRVLTLRPCTSQVITSPSLRPKSRATSLSSDTSGAGSPGLGARRPNHWPAVSFSPSSISRR